MKQYLVILCFLSCLILSAGQTATFCQDGRPTATPTPQQSFEDLVHFDDIIDVDVLGGFEFDWRGTLTPEGFLDGVDGFNEPVYALCRNETEIAADVARVLGKILREPKVIVRIIDRSHRAVVRMDGAVKTPARFRLQRKVNLRELIVLAGGLTDEATGGISIFRPKNLSCRGPAPTAPTGGEKPSPKNNGSETTDITISELLSGKASANPQILSGDLINIRRASPVYVIGAVNNPRPIYSHSVMTLSRAIAMAGGLAKDAEAGRVSILRRSGDDNRVITADLGKIKRSEIEDEILKPFDIIDVAARGGGKRKYPPTFATDINRNRNIAELPLRVVD